MDSLIPPFRENLLQLVPAIRGAAILCAFSGGKDSVTLLSLLRLLEPELGFTVTAAYFNHRIRPDAEAEAAWVSRFCRDRDIPLVTESADVPAFARRRGMNLEEAASRLRYAFLQRRRSGWIATGHTLSDQSETFFMRLLRGSGAAGLAAIHSLRQKGILRPLLIFTEADIRSFLERNHLPHYSDPSNHDRDLVRNRLRHEVLPGLRRAFPELDRRIADAASILGSESDWFRLHARRLLDRRLILGNVLPPGSLESLHPALQRHVLREYLRKLRGDLRGVSLAHIDTLMRRQARQRSLSLPGITLSLRKGFLFPRGFAPPAYATDLPASGCLRIPEIQARIHVSAAHPQGNPAPRSDFNARLDSARLKFPLRVRCARKSDRYPRRGLPHPLRVPEMIRQLGLPAPLRSLRPLVCDAADQPVWLPGYPPAAGLEARENHPSAIRLDVSGVWPGRPLQAET